MPVIMVGASLGIFAYVTGNARLCQVPAVSHIPAGELLIFCAAMAGPAWPSCGSTPTRPRCSCGRRGRAGAGGALGTIAVIVRQEIVLAIMGGIFVVEALSVMLQVSWFKFTKRQSGAARPAR